MGLPTRGTSVDTQRPRGEIRECSLPVSMPLTRGYQDPHHLGPPISRHPSTGRYVYVYMRLNMCGISTTRETLGRTYAQNFQVATSYGSTDQYRHPEHLRSFTVPGALTPTEFSAFSHRPLTSPNRSTNEHHRRRSTTTILNCM